MAIRVLSASYHEVWTEAVQVGGAVTIQTAIPVVGRDPAELSRMEAMLYIDSMGGTPAVTKPVCSINPTTGYLDVSFNVNGGVIAYTLDVHYHQPQGVDAAYAGLGIVLTGGAISGGGGGGGSTDSGEIDEVFWDADATPVFPLAGVGDTRAYYGKVLHEASAPFSPDGVNFYPYVAVYSLQTGSPPCKLRFAFSLDGLTWVNGGQATGIAAAAHHAEIIYIAATNRLLLWYWDEAAGPGAAANLHYAYCTANSIPAFGNDTPLANGATPWITGIGWNASSYGPCRFAYNPSPTNVPGDPTTWRFYGFMNCSNGNNEYLELVVSNDGITWDQFDPNPVLPLVPNSWESLSISYCDFWKLTSGQWMMVYGGGTTSPSGGIGLAFSDDFVSWTKHPANPVFQVGLGQWANRCGAPSRLVVSNVVRMFYTGDPNQPRIYTALRVTRWTRKVLSWGGDPFFKQGRVLPSIQQGLGPPVGVVNGNIGDLYVNLLPAPPGQTLWVSETGGVGGWVPK